MLIYEDILTGDELLSDSFPHTEIENGVLWEVQGKLIELRSGANPSAEGGDDDEGVDNQVKNVLDIVQAFRLERVSFDKKQFVGYINKYIENLTPKLDAEQQQVFKKNIEAATKLLLSKLKDLEFFVGPSMNPDGALVFAYYKDGSTNPTLLYLAHGLKGIKV